MAVYPQHESSRIEFKRSLPKNDQIIKTLIGFCNRFGGKLIIGVEDNAHVIGLSEKEIQDTLEYLEKSIYESCAPPILPQVSYRSFGDRMVLVLQVSSGMNKPYYRLSEGLEKGTYIRLGRNTVRANADMIEELKWSSRGRFFDALPAYHTSINDLDREALDRFSQQRRIGKQARLSQSSMEAYPLIVEEHGKVYPTNAGILCFGKQPQKIFPEAIIICSRFKGVEGREAIASLDCTGPIMNQWEKAFNFIIQHLEKSFRIDSPVRNERLELPEEAIREVLLNLLVHRNYHLIAPAKIAIYDDRIEFYSPGGFAGPIDEGELTEGISYLRNPTICRLFREAGLIEKLGSGFITLFKSYEQAGLVPPTVIEGSNYVKCILPRKVREKSSSADEPTLICALVDQYGEVSVSDVMANLGLSRSTAQRRLKQLADEGILSKFGQGRAVRYRR